MLANSKHISIPPSRLNNDFWKFWIGQTISNLGSSFSNFAFPLLIFKLTGSAVNLALATAVSFLPYLLFGLVIGAWIDNVNRRRIMIYTDVARALITMSIPLLASLNLLSVWWIYVVAFVGSTLSVSFAAAQFAAIPSLVNHDSLVTANGRVRASYSAATVIGPLLAGQLVALLPIPELIIFDALSFLVSALSLTIIKTNFNSKINEKRTLTNLPRDIGEGLRYVLNHPVLRAISVMMALFNFVATTASTQLVLLATHQFHASDTQISLLYAAGSIGIVALSLAAGQLRKYWSFSTVALGALMLNGLLVVVLSLTHWYWTVLLLWALISGMGSLFNINANSLRQAIVPNQMLGRVMSIALVLAWSAIPLGSLIGAAAIVWTKNVVLVYAGVGVLTFLIPLAFLFTPLRQAEHYLPHTDASQVPEPVGTSR